jgi:hypothetical protein
LVWIALPAWLALAFSCTDNNNYTSFFDPSELACSDGVDNDEDGFVDLADPGCFGNPLWDSEGRRACL